MFTVQVSIGNGFRGKAVISMKITGFFVVYRMLSGLLIIKQSIINPPILNFVPTLDTTSVRFW